MIQSRRVFIKSGFELAFSLALLELTSPLSFAGLLKRSEYDEFWIQGDQEEKTSSGRKINRVIAFQSSVKIQTQIEVPSFAHSLVGNPKNPDEIVLMPQFDSITCVVNLRKKRIVSEFKSEAGSQFYGHGLYSPDGKFLLTSESQYGPTGGQLVVRDASTYKKLRVLDTFGIAPHEVRFLADGKTLVVANGGFIRHLDRPDEYGETNVVYLDFNSGKFLRKLNPQSGNAMAGHLEIGSRGELATLFKPRKKDEIGQLLLSSDSSPHLLEEIPLAAKVYQRMTGQALSIKYDPLTEVLGVTSPYGNLVTFWNLKTRRYITGHEIEYPMGIGLTEDRRFVVTTHSRKLRYFDAKTLQPLGDGSDSLGNGSHLLVWKTPRNHTFT